MSDAPTHDPVIAALLRERRGYVVRGLDDRVAAVDEQLELRGYVGAKPEEPADPPARRARPKSTAEQAGKSRA
jgi:hypothetical protein